LLVCYCFFPHPFVATEFSRITINIPLDPSNSNSQKITHECLKLNSIKIEEVFEFFSTFDNIVKILALPSGPQQFQLIPAMMGMTPRKMVQYCDNLRNESVPRRTQKLH
jgi:hypothetical protein